ncbi:tapetum determinant 1-like protein [Tanacetum coccineum]
MVSVMLLVIMLVTIIAFITGVTEGGKMEVMDGTTGYARGTSRNSTTVPNRKLLIAYVFMVANVCVCCHGFLLHVLAANGALSASRSVHQMLSVISVNMGMCGCMFADFCACLMCISDVFAFVAASFASYVSSAEPTTTATAATAATAGAAAAEVAKLQPNRIWGNTCSTSDIVIIQGPSTPLPSGIPTYVVEIMNVCTTGCNISGIHLSCGWFSSARLINPRLFKRLRYDDCVVNEGKPLVNGRTISFQYANTFSYPLTISSIIC